MKVKTRGTLTSSLLPSGLQSTVLLLLPSQELPSEVSSFVVAALLV